MRFRLVPQGEEALKTLKGPSPYCEGSQYRRAWEKTLGALTGTDLQGALIGGWLHMFLWLLSQEDRALILGTVLGRRVAPDPALGNRRHAEKGEVPRLHIDAPGTMTGQENGLLASGQEPVPRDQRPTDNCSERSSIRLLIAVT